MKLKRINIHKVRWERLKNELKSFTKKQPNKEVISAEIMLDTMEAIEKKHVSRDVVSSRYILQHYPEIDKTRLHYGRKTGKLQYTKKGGTFYYKESDVVLWWSEYSKYVQGKK